ncbi:Bag Family Molecular Chaperone Regulator 1 [Manis pentadactyla]|nr:Bag Family Molecular Chaperone Regulator 1 [Manis pentadactyla]
MVMVYGEDKVADRVKDRFMIRVRIRLCCERECKIEAHINGKHDIEVQGYGEVWVTSIMMVMDHVLGPGQGFGLVLQFEVWSHYDVRMSVILNFWVMVYGEDSIVDSDRILFFCEGKLEFEVQGYGVAWVTSIVTVMDQVQCYSEPWVKLEVMVFSKVYQVDRIMFRVMIWLLSEGNGKINLQEYGDTLVKLLLTMKSQVQGPGVKVYGEDWVWIEIGSGSHVIVSKRLWFRLTDYGETWVTSMLMVKELVQGEEEQMRAGLTPQEISEADSFTAPSFPLLSTLSKPPRVPKELLVAFGLLSRAELEVLV